MLARGQLIVPSLASKCLTALRAVRHLRFIVRDKARRLCSCLALELRQDVADVNAHRLLRNSKRCSDLTVRSAVCYLLQNCLFSRGEYRFFQVVPIGRCPGGRCAHACTPKNSAHELSFSRKKWIPKLVEQLPSKHRRFCFVVTREQRLE